MSSAMTSHVWRPSSARRVVLDGFVAVPRGSVVTAPAPLSWPAKDPSDVLDYEFDISAALIGNEGDGIANVTVMVTPNATADLALNNVAADGTVVVLWFAAGQAGIVYSVQITVTTRNGRTIGRTVLLPVVSLGGLVSAQTALLGDAGTVIIDQNGNPILIGS